MPARHRQLVAILVQAPMFKFRIATLFGEQRKRNINLPRIELRLHFANVQLPETELNIGVLAAIMVAHQRQEGAKRSQQKANGNARGHAVFVLGNMIKCRLMSPRNSTRIGKKHLPCLGQAHRVAVALKKLYPQLLLEF